MKKTLAIIVLLLAALGAGGFAFMQWKANAGSRAEIAQLTEKAAETSKKQEEAAAQAPAPVDAPVVETPEPAVADAAPEEQGPENMFKKDEGRWGSGGVAITGVTLRDANGEAGHVFHTGQPMSIELGIKADKPCDDFVFGIAMFNTEEIGRAHV